MKIAYFTDTYLPEINGVANTLSKLSGYLEQKGIRHVFFAPDYDGDAGEDEKGLPALKRIHRFPGLKFKIAPNSRLAFPDTQSIYDLCDEFQPDLIHVTTEFGIGNKGVKYAQFRELPLIMSCHTDYCKYLDFHGLGLLEPFIEIYLKNFYSHAHRTLVPSKYTMEQLLQKGYENLGIWSRGIDTGKFNAEFRSREVRARLGLGDKFAFLFVGRLSPEKGLQMLLDAAGRIESLFPGKTAFVITGDGPYAETIRQAGLKNVIMTGFMRGRELSEIYASCDCFASPSATETFGNTGLEAMASGLPVAAVGSGGVMEYLEDGINALLCEDKDQEAFTKQLIQIMQNESLRQGLAENGRKTALARSWNKIFEGLLNEYETVLRQNMMAELKRVS